MSEEDVSDCIEALYEAARLARIDVDFYLRALIEARPHSKLQLAAEDEIARRAEQKKPGVMRIGSQCQ